MESRRHDRLWRLVTDRVNRRTFSGWAGVVCDLVVEVVDVDAAAISVRSSTRSQELAAASDEWAGRFEELQYTVGEGPGVQAFEDGGPVLVSDLVAAQGRWPGFVGAATDAGLAAVFAFPLRLDSHAVGGLNVLYRRPTDLSDGDRRLGQALADLAVLGLTQERDDRRAERLAEQTLTTINDRIHVGQAVGVLAGALTLSPDDARARLVAHAESTGRSLLEVVRAVTDGSLSPAAIGNGR